MGGQHRPHLPGQRQRPHPVPACGCPRRCTTALRPHWPSRGRAGLDPVHRPLPRDPRAGLRPAGAARTPGPRPATCPRLHPAQPRLAPAAAQGTGARVRPHAPDRLRHRPARPGPRNRGPAGRTRRAAGGHRQRQHRPRRQPTPAQPPDHPPPRPARAGKPAAGRRARGRLRTHRPAPEADERRCQPGACRAAPAARPHRHAALASRPRTHRPAAPTRTGCSCIFLLNPCPTPGPAS